ncbi:MAG: leucine-rich repeat domain-containing protein [Oscillospiraceae bacterium]|nr:leucine-rich repeat domain-containing protein [Oscillospiraceae bacterium]
MYKRDNKPFIIGGSILAVLLVGVILLLTLGGGGKYQKHFEAAQEAYARTNYGTAAQELKAALDEKKTEEAYLLLSNVYLAQGDRDQAVQTLLLGYSHVGGQAIADQLERLNGSVTATPAPRATELVAVGGRTFTMDTISVVLSGRELRDDDLVTLCELRSLENLSISDNAITDLSPIANLENLTSLQLSNNFISDLQPLSGLTDLKTLYLDGNPVGDFSPLYSLKNLRTLSMKNVDVTGGELKDLEEALPGCYIVSDTRLPEAEQLNLGGQFFSTEDEELSLTGLNLTDISLLSRCPQLCKLDLRDNGVSDLSPLAELEKLDWLRLWNNRVQDISPLAGLTALRYLDLDGNSVSDLSALSGLDRLEELWLNNNALDSLEPLSGLPSLKKLELKNTGLSDGDLSALYGLRNLKELSLADNPELTDGAVEALRRALPNCEIDTGKQVWTVDLGGKTFSSDAASIDASNCGLRSVKSLEHFENLEVLLLDGNDLTDLSPLYGLTGLRTLSVRDNPRLTEAEVARFRRQNPDCEVLSGSSEPEPTQTPKPSETPEPTQTPAPSETPGSAQTPAPTETPAPVESAAPVTPDEEELKARGAQAALDAAGTASGYAIFRLTTDDAGEHIRRGFVEMAEELGMHLVYDGGTPANTVNYQVFLTGMRNRGADLVFLAVDDWTYAEIVSQAEAMGYTPEFRQIYN